MRAALLEAGQFDFTGDERYDYDREDAPWAADAAALDDAVDASRCKNDWLRLKLAGKTAGRDPQDARQALRQPRRAASHELNGEDVFQTFLNAYADAIDPHTDYFTPRTRRELQHADVAVAGRHRRGAAEAGRSAS